VSPDLRLTTLRIADDSYACSAVGELDAFTAGRLRDELQSLRERGGRRLIVDLGSVTFIDSAGLGMLLTEAERLSADGGALIIVSDDPRTLRILEVTGAARQFRIEQSLADAVDGLAHQLLT
jgi:anti-sigma B factor antagonist